MNDLLISLLVFALIFGGALAGMAVRPLLSEQHQTPDWGENEVQRGGDSCSGRCQIAR